MSCTNCDSNNPFSGIITPALKGVFNNAIDALLEDTALTRLCRLVYGVTRYETCTNCGTEPSLIGRKANYSYVHGGPVPFGFGQSCPVCGGSNKLPIESSEQLYLGVILNARKFLPVEFRINVADGTVAQTLCKASLLPKIKQANYAVFDLSLERANTYKYQRAAEPEAVGWGDNRYIITVWKRV